MHNVRIKINRQSNFELRSCTNFRLNIDLALMHFSDDRVNDCQALPSPLADLFRCIERLEHFLVIADWYAASVVSYRDLNVFLAAASCDVDFSETGLVVAA